MRDKRHLKPNLYISTITLCFQPFAGKKQHAMRTEYLLEDLPETVP